MVMRWASTIYTAPNSNKELDFQACVSASLKEIKDKLAGNPVNLLFGFVSSHFREYYPDLPGLVKRELSPDVFIGSSAGGLIGGGKEVEAERSFSFIGASMPEVDLNGFYLSGKDLPDLDDGQESWYKLIGVKPSDKPAFVIITDPFSFRSDILVRGLDFAYPYPDSVKIGGLASGAMLSGENGLFLNDNYYDNGMVGLSISGNVIVDTVVAQGCKAVGKPFTITKCKKNILYELDGNPAVMALKEVIDSLSENDKELIKDSVFLGVVLDEMKDSHQSGDFLIRNILGIEPTSGALVIGELLDQQKTVQFHVRDAATSNDDLRFLLKRYREETLDSGKFSPSGALLFSCLGRGVYLYGRPNHDSDCFFSYVGQVPLGGFFCNGEIGPVGSNTFLHGYTSSFGIFRERQESLKQGN